MDSLYYARQGVIRDGAEGAVQSVAGFASLHVAITLLVALMVQYTLRSRILHVVFWVNFSITVLDASNASTGELLVNTIGGYSGTTAWGLNAFGEGVKLQITADGPWTLTIAPFSAAGPVAPAGTGDAVMLYDDDAASLTATHAGTRNFVVYQETEEAFNMGLLVNEIGAYSGTVPLSAGPSILTVTADGAWTLAIQ